MRARLGPSNQKPRLDRAYYQQAMIYLQKQPKNQVLIKPIMANMLTLIFHYLNITYTFVAPW